MVRLIAAALGGLIVGAVAVWIFTPGPDPTTVVRDIVAVPKMSGTDAATHRADGYAKLSTIEEIAALPTAFARAEALFALAGRSGPAELQTLIFDANRVADDNNRRESLSTLFFRLAEADPESALALSRTEFFRHERNLEFVVWQTWGRNDLDAALFAAKTQTSTVHQNSAAQALYAAHGDLGSETADRIEAELGIPPNRDTRGRFLYRLADRSPAEAIDYINGMPDGMAKSEYLSWLGHYLAGRDPDGAESYANLLADNQHREIFIGNVRQRAALENPSAEIDRILASGDLNRNVGPLHSAMRTLVMQDMDAALAYFESFETGDHRQVIGALIASEYAKQDPVAALAWARENEVSQHGQIEMEVLSTIARSDPQQALAEALQERNPNMRHQLVSMVVNTVAHDDPLQGIALLESLDDQRLVANVRQNLASGWLMQDADAAIDWILSLDDRASSELLNNVSWALIQSDVDAAIRVMPRVDRRSQVQWRNLIANTLVMERSVDEALQFARQYENEPDYPQIQASIIQSVAATDIAQAQYLADRITDVQARDQAYSSIIGQHAQTDPQAALTMVDSIANDSMRTNAIAMVASSWHEADPAPAMRWLTNLPRGADRDYAITHVASQWNTVSQEQEALINSISDAETRGRLKIQRAYAVAQFDQALARELLDDPDIPEDMRRQALQHISRDAFGY